MVNQRTAQGEHDHLSDRNRPDGLPEILGVLHLSDELVSLSQPYNVPQYDAYTDRRDCRLADEGVGDVQEGGHPCDDILARVHASVKVNTDPARTSSP